jgi:hypothetical protein
MQFVAAAFCIMVLASILLSWLGGGDINRGEVVLWHLVEMGALIWAAYVAYLKRDDLARLWHGVACWYYFTFHPHPAEPAVRSAIDSGRLLDGNQLAAVLGEAPPGNKYFREVRVAQTATLIGDMQTATNAQLHELNRQAQDKFAQAAVHEAQAALGAAAVALETAKAMLSASRRSGNL